MTLQMPGYSFVRQKRWSRFAFEWRADDLGLLTSSSIIGLADNGEIHVPTPFVRTGASDLSDSGYCCGRWLGFGRLPLLYPRWWAYDLDNDGIGETLTLLTEPGATNLIPNAFCGTNTTGWDATASATLTRVALLDTGAPSQFGHAGLLSVTAAAAGVTLHKDGASGLFVATAGQFYAFTVCANVSIAAAAAGQTWTIAIRWRTSGGALISTTSQTYTATRPGRVPWIIMAAAPATSAFADVQILAGTPLLVNPATLYIELVQYEVNGASSPIPADTTAAALKSRATEPPVQFGFPELISPLGCTIYAKAVCPRSAGLPAQVTNGILCLGSPQGTGGGVLSLIFLSGAAIVTRQVGATGGGISTAVVPASAVAPFEFLGHCAPDGTVDAAVRDAAGSIWASVPAHPGDVCTAHPATVGTPYANSTLILGGVGGGGVAAGSAGMIAARYTPGIRTFDQMGIVQ